MSDSREAPDGRGGGTRSGVRALRWTGQRWWAKARHKAVSRLFRDQAGDRSRTVLVAGVARSGTTWLAEILASQQPTRLMFEPFHARRVPGFGAFEYAQYMRPTAHHPQLEAFADAVLSGRIRDPHWIDQHVDCLLPRHRVVKDVRVGLFLRWLHDRFPEVPILYIVRHPCAVVASHERLKWSTSDDLRSMLAQPELVEDHLAGHLDLLGRLTEPWEQHAAVWCIHNRVVFRQFADRTLEVVHYEDLVQQPEPTLSRVFEVLGRRFDPSILRAHARRSATVFANSPLLSGEDPPLAWPQHTKSARTERILEIVRAFGLDRLYGNDGLPADGRLRSGAARTADQ